MKKIYFADIETTEFNLTEKRNVIYKLDFLLGCVIRFNDNSEIIEKFHSNSQIDYCDFFIKKANFHNKTIVYFHNLKFDIKFLIEKLTKSFEIIDFIVAGNKTISIQCKKMIIKTDKNGKKRKVNVVGLEFRDSLSILLTSIKVLGKMLKLPKLSIDFSNNKELELIEYCYRDCEIIYYSLHNLCNSLNDIFSKYKIHLSIKNIKLTIASISKYIFQILYNSIFFKANKNIEKNFRKYYFGGRVEVFDFNLKKDVNYNDINSLYPFILSNFDFCDNNIDIIDISDKNIELNKILRLKGFIGLECIISENQEIPIYPIRLDNKVLFVNGVKKSFISKYEILKLIELNIIPKNIQILKIKKIVLTKNIVNFNKFFNTLYNLRKKTKGFMNYVIKILMNSLYGKFTQKIKREMKAFLNSLENIDLNEFSVIEHKGFFYTISEFSNYRTTINLINGILTTNYARFYLWLSLYNSNNPIYCDTDSIVSNSLKNAIFNNNLGNWKKEFIASKFQAIDTKEYFFDNKEKRTFGIKLKSFNVKSLSNVSEIKELYKNGIYNHRVNSIFQCIRQKIEFECASIYKKVKRSIYVKRIIQTDLTTKPINITKDKMILVYKNNKKYIKQIIENL